MSASLVGSEMCIRDSHSTDVSKYARPRGSMELRSGNLRSSRTGQGSGTVSYTHLTLPTICSV
eukprot:10597671-Alexandrium_andersonii.AAC.1